MGKEGFDDLISEEVSKFVSYIHQHHANQPVNIGHIFHQAHYLKITQNVAFEFLNFGIFHQFNQLKVSGLVTLFDRKLQARQN